MNSVTQQLAEFIAESRYEDLPENVVHEAKRVFLDSMGCALAGMATGVPAGEAIREVVQTIWALEEVKDIASLMEALRSPT